MTTTGSSVSAANYTISTNANGLLQSAGTVSAGPGKNANELIDDAWTNASGGNVFVDYTVTPISGAGCSGVPFLVRITVQPEPVVNSIASSSYCAGQAVNVNFSSNVSGSIQSWTNSNTAIGLGASGVGNLNFTTAANVSGADQVATIVVTASSAGCVSGASNQKTFTITVKPSPVISTVADITLCPGATIGPINFTANTGGSEIFNWTNSNTLIGLPLTGSGNISSYVAPANTTGSSYVGNISVTATKNGCTGSAIVFRITVLPQPVLSAQSDVIYCPGQSVNINFVSNVAGSNISWTNSNTAIGIGASGVGNLSFTAPPNNTSSNIFGDITVLASQGGCVSAPLLFKITIKPSPLFTVTNTTSNICETTPVDITLTSITAGAVITLTSVNYGAVIGTPLLAGATFTDGQKITETLSNPTNLPVTVVYTFSVSANGCSNSVQQSTSVVVRPNPSANGSDATICAGQNAVVSINASPENVPGTTYDWTITASGNVVGASVDNGSTINQNLTLSNYLVGTVQYQITPTANGCVGPVKNVNVTVNPIAIVDAGLDYQVCEPVTIPLSGTIGGAATSGTWVIVSGAGSISLSTTSGAVVTATYTVNPSDVTTTIIVRLETNDPDGAGPCTLVSDLLNIQINRRPTVVVPADYTVCEPVSFLSTPILLTGTIGGSASTGLWSVVTGAGGLSATNVSGTNVTANYVINTLDVGTTITFRLTTNDSDGLGPCTTSFDDINIHINPRPIVSAGPDLALCQNIPTIALQGSFAGSTTAVLWTGGTGIFSNNASSTSNYNFNNPSEINTNITLTLTALDPDATGPCTSVSDQMVLKINPLPIVVFTGLPPGAPPNMAENQLPLTLTGNQIGGVFTITPVTSNIGSTVANPVDKASFDPGAVTLGLNTITYTFMDGNSCVNRDNQNVIVNPVTTASFAIQNGNFNTLTSTHEICSDQGDLVLRGNPDFNTYGPNQFTATAGLTINQTGSPGSFTHTITTNGLPSGTYFINYRYTNAFGATTDNTFAVKVFASPVAVISNLANNCISAPVNFNDGSTIRATPYPTSISSWRWDFKDGTSANVQNPSHLYTLSGLYNVDLSVTTTQGCVGTTTRPIRVGDVPVVDFDWSAICTNDQTKYLDKTKAGSISTIVTYTWDFGDGDVLTGPNGGTVASGTHGNRTTGTFKNPQHNFVLNGTYNTKLSVFTDDLCNNSKTQSVFILPAGATVTPNSSTPYFKDFDSGNEGWISEGLKIAGGPTPVMSPNSWKLGVPSGTTITSATPTWWTGNNGNTYYLSEQSAVNGPCFDLTQLSRPMIAMDYWSDVEQNLDGAALQYSTDGGLIWNIVGPPTNSPNEGINWYNGQIVQSNPGQQPFGSNGWTAKVGSWKNARFHLDMIPSTARGQVRIRVAFSSNGSNNPNLTFDGFAFDNVFVGDKKRNVLVEHFTNATQPTSVLGDTWINNRYQDQITLIRPGGKSDFNDIQYHISNPNPDPLNLDNPSDPAARSLYYGVSQPPATIMDGILNSKLTGTYTDLDLAGVEVDRRALVDPLFDLTLTELPTATTNLISVKLSITALQNSSTPLIAQVSLIENQTGTFKKVLRKQLLGADGETITLTFNKGDILSKQNDNILINVPITNSGQLTLVGYVQNKNTKEIYQSIVIPASSKQGSLTVGLEEQSIPTTLNGISIYPNPANGSFYFGIPEDRTFEGFSWKLIDQRGIMLKSGDFEGLINHTKQVEVADFANGIYFIMLSGPGKSVVHRKIVIMNRN